MDTFKDKVAIVTGGASGIGRALCEALAERGAAVKVADIDLQGAQRAASAIEAAGGRAVAVGLDVTRNEDVLRVVEETARESGRLDFLFNNAGIAVGGEARDVDIEHWRRVIDVDLWGVINGSLAAYPLMVRQGAGHIVNTASLAGLMPAPLEISYTVSKYGVVGFSKALRAEGAELGVRVSVVCPGLIRTGIYETTPFLKVDKAGFLKKIPERLKMDAGVAARVILRGVASNRAVIVVTFHAKVLWWIERFFPSILFFLALKGIREFRLLRRE